MRSVQVCAVLITATAIVLSLSAPARPASKASPAARVGAFYFDGWSGKLGNFHWGGLLGTEYSGRRPLSGWTDDRPDAVDTQLRWAHAAGISFFVFDWYHEPDPGNGPINMAFETYWKLPDHSDVEAAIAYVNQPGFVIPPEKWSAAVESWVANYFTKRDYVRVNGRPLLVILDESLFIRQWGGAVGANNAIAELQAAARRHGLPGVFVVGGRYLDWNSEQCFPRCIETDSDFASVRYDAITEFSYPYILDPRDGPRPYSEVAAAIKRTWGTIADRSPFAHIPSVMAGFDPRPMLLAGQVQRPEDGGWPLLNGHQTWFVTTPADVGGLVGDAIEWVRRHPAMRVEANPASPIVLIQSWNELQEGAILVPTDANGYAYGQAIAAALGIPWTPPPKRSLTTSDSDRGTVTSKPPGIACPPTCSARFDQGWEVTLAAKQKRGSTLDGWTGCTAKEATCSVILTKDSRARPVLTATVQRRALTLQIHAHLASGRVTAVDGFQPCGASTRVLLQREQAVRWVRAGSSLTNAVGRYSLKLPTRPGRYRASVATDGVSGHLCRSAVSAARTANR